MERDGGKRRRWYRKGPNSQDGEDCAAKPEQGDYTALGWDFDSVWKTGEDYPALRWEG
jgi:hypothetical protein